MFCLLYLWMIYSMFCLLYLLRIYSMVCLLYLSKLTNLVLVYWWFLFVVIFCLLDYVFFIVVIFSITSYRKIYAIDMKIIMKNFSSRICTHVPCTRYSDFIISNNVKFGLVQIKLEFTLHRHSLSTQCHMSSI